jgi:hypothetical protein
VAHPNTRQPVKRATEWAWLCRRRRGLDRLTVGIPGVPLRSTPGYCLTPASRVERVAHWVFFLCALCALCGYLHRRGFILFAQPNDKEVSWEEHITMKIIIGNCSDRNQNGRVNYRQTDRQTDRRTDRQTGTNPTC